MPPNGDPTYPLYPILAFFGFVLSLIPLPWHVQAWNSGTCAFMLWTGTICLAYFINSLVWRGSVENVAPVWCDISTKLTIGVSVGIPAAILCISRRMYKITTLQAAFLTRQDKRRMVLVDLCIALGLPILIMALHIIVQSHRFDILEDIGCHAVIYNTPPAYPLILLWPFLLGTLSSIYSALTLRAFWLHKSLLRQHLSPSPSSTINISPSLTLSRYRRLILLSLLDITFTLPLSIYTLYIANKGVALSPYTSWRSVHHDFSHVGQYSAEMWRADEARERAVEMTRWLPVFCALLFWGVVGTAREARERYGRVWRSAVRRWVRGAREGEGEGEGRAPAWVRPLRADPNATIGALLPVHVHRDREHDAPHQARAWTGTSVSFTVRTPSHTKNSPSHSSTSSSTSTTVAGPPFPSHGSVSRASYTSKASSIRSFYTAPSTPIHPTRPEERRELNNNDTSATRTGSGSHQASSSNFKFETLLLIPSASRQRVLL
ncbi:hypothetical protein AX16_002759 [Volvariella volvacea WC 439]|nr:hypothetical protein AX16_002759 [Volvariella volvacea WC 439]